MVGVEMRRAATPVGIALVGGCLVGLAFVAIAIRSYPASDEQTTLYFVAAGLLVFCGLVALLTTRPRTAEGMALLRLGTFFGLAIGAFWIVEIVTGNLVAVESDASHAVYRAATAIAAFLPLVAGAAATYQTGRIRSGVAVGFWSGLVSGMIGFLTLVFISYFFIGVLQHDPQTLQEYAHSTERTLPTYIVGDFLAAACAHLVIVGVAWCTLLGSLGGFVGMLLKRSQTTEHRDRVGSQP
jgi:hypothetical protein